MINYRNNRSGSVDHNSYNINGPSGHPQQHSHTSSLLHKSTRSSSSTLPFLSSSNLKKNITQPQTHPPFSSTPHLHRFASPFPSDATTLDFQLDRQYEKFSSSQNNKFDNTNDLPCSHFTGSLNTNAFDYDDSLRSRSE